jgi:hypothetical protein
MHKIKKIIEKEYRIYSLISDEFPKNTYILYSNISQSILYNPHIAGKNLQDRLDEMGVVFINAMRDVALAGTRLSNCCELILLSGGLYYNLNHGFKKIYNEALPQCFLGIKRARIEGTEGKFTAAATYENFEALPNNATVIIGDTIATGATMQNGLNRLFDALDEKDYTLDKLVICTLAGSTKGARKLRETEEKMKTLFPKAKLYFIACEQLFHLMPDGTDLRFFGEDAVAPDETNENTRRIYGEYLGKEMKCAVFDWGTRCKNPKKHYEEFLDFAEEILSRKLDEKSKSVIERMKRETEKSLRDFEKKL